MKIKTLEWTGSALKIIDQTKLPDKLAYLYIKDLLALWRAIRELKVRGAPALGAAAGLGVYLGVKDFKGNDFYAFSRKVDEAAKYIGSSRPTARNLFWGLERMKAVVLENRDKPVSSVKKILLDEAKRIIEEDREACRNIGRNGCGLIKDNARVLTICNAGILATIDYGTALGVVYSAKEEGKDLSVYALETRPLLQGSRLTAWELNKSGVDVSIVCDNMAATLMRQGMIDLVVAGADRITACGDAANKIGTHGVAILAKYHNIPFYVAAPASTFDLSIDSGSDILIEERDPGEVSTLLFKKTVAPKGVKVFNPAFDVTPAALISAIISDKGLITPPYKDNIARIIGK